ncbi:hypothetical protein SQQ66_15815 [Enterococcus casseliflavus]|uniref:phage baseplate protein n=1 Tax=Enterococcus casseliflavus TaxID=37734 RepID=UPI002FDC2099
MTDIVQLQQNGKGVYMKTHGKAIDALVDSVYPVGAVFISVSDVNPESYFGGTWERIANGRTLVGVDSSDTALNGSGKTGGAVNPLTTHSHSFSGRTSDAGLILGVASGGDLNFSAGNSGGIKTSNHSHSYSGTTTSQGSNNDHSNWQPFFTVYMWVRKS